MNKSESEISRAIGTYLTSKGYKHWRNQSGQVRVNGGYMHLGINGLADRTVMLNGCHLYIEVKTLTGKQKEAQKDFEDKCNELGHHYMIARSVDDVKTMIEGLI